MKKLIFAIALITILVAGTALTGCSRVLISTENGSLSARDYDFTDFTGIEIGHAFELEVTPSDVYKVTITAGESILKRIDVSKSGSVLKIDMDGWFFSWHSTPKVTITMPVLTWLDLSGASKGNARGFKSSEDFKLSLSGASNLDIDMEAGKFESDLSGASRLIGYLIAESSSFDVSGASEVKLTGSGGDLVVDGSGASHFALSDFAANNADIELSGATHASLNISGRMDVSLSGASSLEYYGNPTLGRLDISGASDIEQKTER